MFPPTLKLGRLPRKYDKRTLKLERYLAPGPYPTTRKYKGSFILGHNDTAGDCVEVAGANAQIGLSTATKRQPLLISDDQVLQDYSRRTGFDPATGANDTGLVELDFLNSWRTDSLFGNRIAAYASVADDAASISQAINTFGGLFLGVELPLIYQGATSWDVEHLNWFEKLIRLKDTDANPGSWGGHGVWAYGYDSTGVWVVSWKEEIHFSFDAMNVYCSERYALVDSLFLDPTSGMSPNNLNLGQLLSDLKNVTA